MSGEWDALIDTGNPLDKLRQSQHVYRHVLDVDDELAIDELRDAARADAEQAGRIVAELIDELIEVEQLDDNGTTTTVMVYEARVPIIKERA